MQSCTFPFPTNIPFAPSQHHDTHTHIPLCTTITTTITTIILITFKLGLSLSTTLAAACMTAWQLPSLPVLLQVWPALGLMQLLLGDRRTRLRGSGR